MAFSPKAVGDWVRIVNSNGDLVQIARVTDTTGARYIAAGMWFTAAGNGKGSAEDGYTIEDASAGEIASQERAEKLLELSAFDWAQMSDADLDTVKAVVDSY